MRVEQRIGRIDRIGQPWPTVEVQNYFIPGTIEERVYELLAERVDDFSDLLGNLQPILGATEDALRAVFRTPRPEREAAEREQLEALDRRIVELRGSGVDLDVDDPTPMPPHPPSPVTLEQLANLASHLRLRVGHPNRPATFDPAQVSRDAKAWRALATYGHPDLVEELERVAGDDGPAGPLVVGRHDGEGVAVIAAARADRTPPRMVRSVEELGLLGEATSTGEAQTLADSVARREGLARLERKREVLGFRMVKVEEAIRQRFIRLVHRQIAAECAASRDAGEISPTLVWLDMTRDQVTGWSYADTFRATLDLTIEEVAPARLGEPGAVSSAEAKRVSRLACSEELMQLMREYRAVRDAPL